MKAKISLHAVVMVIGIFFASFASADESRIVIAADSSSGTYAKMAGEIIAACSTEDFTIDINKGITGGAVGNLQALVDNKVQAAFLHSDVFTANSMADPTYNRFQALVALYPEPIHVIALKHSKTSVKGAMSYLGNKQEFNSLADVRGFSVGAAGGGVFTARILTGQGEGGFAVIPFDSGDKLIAALNNGEIAAAIFVGAAPLPNLEKLNKANYKIIPIGESIAAKVTGVYRPATVNYPGMTSGPVKTLAPLATVMTRKFSTPARVAAQRNFRQCFNKHLGELQDNGAPNWQQVNAGDHGVLPWYEIPEPEVVATNRKKK